MQATKHTPPRPNGLSSCMLRQAQALVDDDSATMLPFLQHR